MADDKAVINVRFDPTNASRLTFSNYYLENMPEFDAKYPLAFWFKARLYTHENKLSLTFDELGLLTQNENERKEMNAGLTNLLSILGVNTRCNVENDEEEETSKNRFLTAPNEGYRCTSEWLRIKLGHQETLSFLSLVKNEHIDYGLEILGNQVRHRFESLCCKYKL